MSLRPANHSLSPLLAALLAAGCGTFGLDSEASVAADLAAASTSDDDSEGDADDGGPGDEADSDDDGSDDDSSGAGGDGDSSPADGDDPSDAECTHDGFDILIHQATQDDSVPGQPMFMYQARDTDLAPFDELQILSYQAAPYYGPSTPGQYRLAGTNYADCGLCVLVVTDCDDGYSCDEVYFVSEGTLDVADFGAASGRFRAVLRDAVFLEVSIDPSTHETTPVPGGASWCVGEVDIDVSTYRYP